MGTNCGYRRIRVLGYQGRPRGSWAGPRGRDFLRILDSYYLREERLFRYLYDDARRGKVGVYSMNKNEYSSKCKRRSVICSWSVLGFYGPLLLVGLGALSWSILG